MADKEEIQNGSSELPAELPFRQIDQHRILPAAPRNLISIVRWSIRILAACPRDSDGNYAGNLGLRWAEELLTNSGIELKRELDGAIDSSNGPYIFMANHQSLIDVPVLASALKPIPISWVASRWVAKVPLFGWAFKRLDPVLVEPGNKGLNRIAMLKAKEKLSQGNSLLVFPEGERSLNCELLPLKSGFFYLAIRTNTPVVPVTIVGAREVLRPGEWKIRAGVVQVVIGTPLDTRGASVEELKEAVKTKIEQTRFAITTPDSLDFPKSRS